MHTIPVPNRGVAGSLGWVGCDRRRGGSPTRGACLIFSALFLFLVFVGYILPFGCFARRKDLRVGAGLGGRQVWFCFFFLFSVHLDAGHESRHRVCGTRVNCKPSVQAWIDFTVRSTSCATYARNYPSSLPARSNQQ